MTAANSSSDGVGASSSAGPPEPGEVRAEVVASSRRAEAQVTEGHRPPRARSTALGRPLVFALPLAYLAVQAFRQRWTSDDGFINFRVVSQILAGHGPVFNAGQRVEATTSSLWVWLLAAVHFVVRPVALEVEAALLSGAFMVAGLALVMRAAWRYWSIVVPDRPVWPLGVVALVLYPPLWDFSTSGLEEGLSVFWVGVSLWTVANAYAGVASRRRTGRLALRWFAVLGLGFLIRPDFVVLSVIFFVALVVIERGGWRSWAAPLLVMLALPVASQVFRMAYYASLVPNTALDKEASLSYWSEGLRYVGAGLVAQFVFVPLVAGVALTAFWLSRSKATIRDMAFPAAAVLGGAFGLVYEAKVGGDFMMGRMVLTSLVLLVAPAAVAPLPPTDFLRRPVPLVATLTLIVWAGAAGLLMNETSRTPIGGPGGHAQFTDERFYWAATSGSRHPLTAADWAAGGGTNLYCQGDLLNRLSRSGVGVSIYTTAIGGSCESMVGTSTTLTPLPQWRDRQVAIAGSIGVLAYVAGPNVTVVDDLGLASPYGSRVELATPRTGRVGHEKLHADWAMAPYASIEPPLAGSLPPATEALTCGEIGVLTAAIDSPLTAGRAWRNLLDAPRLTLLRFPADPAVVVDRYCR